MTVNITLLQCTEDAIREFDQINKGYHSLLDDCSKLNAEKLKQAEELDNDRRNTAFIIAIDMVGQLRYAIKKCEGKS